MNFLFLHALDLLHVPTTRTRYLCVVYMCSVFDQGSKATTNEERERENGADDDICVVMDVRLCVHVFSLMWSKIKILPCAQWLL